MNDTNEMREKIEELKDILKDTNPEDRIYVIMEYIKENEKSEEFDAYFDTDINIKSYTKYENVENYISLLDNTDEQIYLAQKLCDFDLAEKLFKNYPFSKEQKEKFEKLLQNNEDLTKTLNPQILTSKYDFLDSIIDFITAERNSLSQDIILKMDDKNLEIFKILYEKIDKDTVDKLSKVWYVVRHIVYDYSELNADLYEKIKNGEKLNDDIINKLLWLYTQDTLVTAQTIEIKSRIRTLEDLNNLQSIIKETCNKFVNIQRNLNNKNSEKIKESILLSTYGITLRETKSLLNRFHLSDIEINEENKKQLLMYLALSQICNEKNPDKLISIYDDYIKENDISIDYLSTAVLKGELKRLFAREFNNAYSNVNDFQKINDNDKIPIYDAGTNFKICMTALGAFQKNFKEQENYFTYWNSKKIMNHTSSCSLISNNNLTTARIVNICLGFSNFEEEMFLGASYKDMASDSQYGLMAPQLPSTNLWTPENLINRTRSSFNELVYERKDLSNGKYYKKNPDFIVFFEEFDKLESIDTSNLEVKNILDDEKKKWQETMKAANDFGVPIVKINRERCAKSESEKIEQNFKEYLRTYNPSLLANIITNFENNRTSTRGHEYLTEKYFSSEKIQDMLNQIKDSLGQLTDTNLKKDNFVQINNLLQQEKKYANTSDIKSESEIITRLGINVDEYLKDLKMEMQLNISESER